MKHIKRALIILTISGLITGCLISSDDDNILEVSDRGGYTVHVEPVKFMSHPYGGRLLLVSINPDNFFTGTVTLSVDSPEFVKTIVTNSTLTRETNVTEIEVYVDSLLTSGMKQVNVICTHAGTNVSTTVEIYVTHLPHLELAKYGQIPPKQLVKWFEENYPEYEIISDNSWFCFVENPTEPSYILGSAEKVSNHEINT